MNKTWKEFNTYEVKSESVAEKIIFEQKENMFRIRNEFGNMSMEFDLSTGLVFAKSLLEDMKYIAHEEVTEFLNETDPEYQSDDFGAD